MWITGKTAVTILSILCRVRARFCNRIVPVYFFILPALEQVGDMAVYNKL